METTRAGKIWTFYSYKGGVGRSLALANVAAVLARWGYRVLCIDWDLEAPGLHLYFGSGATVPVADGVVELVERHASGMRPDWRDYCGAISLPQTSQPIGFIGSGRLDESFISRMQALDWESLYREHDLGGFFEELRDEWKREFDVVLVDSRTGVTDIGGVCTVQLPDFLAILFTANRQSIDGGIKVARRAGEALNSLPYDRGRLPTLPIVTRFEAATEVDLARQWLKLIDEQITPVVSTWLDRTVPTEKLLDHIKVPYVPHWSFGERLPVIEEGTTDPLSIGYAFETIASLVAHGLEYSALLSTNRSSYVDAAARAAGLQIHGSPDERYLFDVFVSYGRRDHEYAHALVDALAGFGLRVSSDVAAADVGQDWPTSITDAIGKSRNMVALVGDEQTKWVEAESRQFLLGSLTEAADDRLFIPVLMTPDAGSGSRQLSNFRSVDASARSPADVAEELRPLLTGEVWPS